MRLRPATRADAASITALEAELFGADAWPAATVDRTLENDQVVVADPFGYVVVSVTGEVADLQRIAVGPAHRRGGIAHALLGEAAGAARIAGAERMLLEVRADNADALGFYAAEGFVGIDRRRHYYRDGADAVVMELVIGAGRGGGV